MSPAAKVRSIDCTERSSFTRTRPASSTGSPSDDASAANPPTHTASPGMRPCDVCTPSSAISSTVVSRWTCTSRSCRMRAALRPRAGAMPGSREVPASTRWTVVAGWAWAVAAASCTPLAPPPTTTTASASAILARRVRASAAVRSVAAKSSPGIGGCDVWAPVVTTTASAWKVWPSSSRTQPSPTADTRPISTVSTKSCNGIDASDCGAVPPATAASRVTKEWSGEASTSVTATPARSAARTAWRPAYPPPTTRTPGRVCGCIVFTRTGTPKCPNYSVLPPCRPVSDWGGA